MTQDVLLSDKASNSNCTIREKQDNGNLVISKQGNFTRGQDCPKFCELKRAIYIINFKFLKSMQITEFNNVKKYVMDEIYSQDIDNKIDRLIAEALLAESSAHSS